MKVALAHELLTMKGGAERVARVLFEMFPEAPLYTFLYNEAKLGDWFPKERVVTSRLKQQPPWSYNHHHYLKRFPKAVENWDFSGYDLVISSSSAFMHGLKTSGSTKHITYVHSPARYLWDRYHDVRTKANNDLFGSLKQRYFESAAHKLRVWDAKAAERADTILVPSKNVQRRTELYWQRPSTVVHAPISNFWFEDTALPPIDHEPYYFIASTLVPYKNIELAIEACNQLGKNLLIAGSGPDRSRLETIAGPTVEFVGRVDDIELKALYTNAKAVLFPGNEDFGLVPIEAAACGTPTIAQQIGGALETVVAGQTGEFFGEPTEQSLATTIERFEQNEYDPALCKEQAGHFTEDTFKAAIQKQIEAVMS